MWVGRRGKELMCVCVCVCVCACLCVSVCSHVRSVNMDPVFDVCVRQPIMIRNGQCGAEIPAEA